MGLPLVGETFQFFSSDASLDIPPFIRHRLARYGPIFKTSLVGHPVVVSADEELNHMVFQQEGQLFQSWYPDSFVEILGKDNVGEQQGATFRYLKNMVLRYFGPESLKEGIIRDVERAVSSSLCTWSTLPAVELKEAVSTMVFDLAASKLLGLEPSRSKILRKSFFDFVRGLISFPLYLPGTAYYSCMQGRRRAMVVLEQVLEERKQSTGLQRGGEAQQHGDFLDYVIQEITKEKPVMTEKMALDLMFVLLFASFHTTSLALTLAVKLLADHPLVLEELTVEHDTILKDRDAGSELDRITWKEYKSMAFTSQVINETVRLANIAPVIFRKALKDIRFNAVHLNPYIYPDPLTFIPSRFKDKPEINRGSKHFMAFGGGLRFCVGADFSKLQLAIFLHFLVTKYRWIPLGASRVVRTPGLEFPDGYRIQDMEKSELLLGSYSYAALCGVTLIIGWLAHWVYKWMNPPCIGRLPPGSMGFPIIGETFQFFRASPSIDMPSYYKQRLERYGPLFKTSLVGRPVIISLDPEVNRFIFQQEGKLFQSWYPETAINIFGKKSLTTYNGTIHKFIRGVAAKLFGLENLKESLLPELENSMRESFASWTGKPSVEVQDGVSDMIFDLVAKKLIGLDVTNSRELRKNFQDFFQGMVSFPIYFPGTSFYRSMQGRRNVRNTLTDIMKERLSAPGKKYGDLVDLIVEELQSEKPMIDENFAIDALAALLFTSFATLSSTLTVAFKYLTDNPKVVEELKEEHGTILKKREGVNYGFTWEEYRSLKFSTQVMNEITRISNVTPGVFRKTLTDVQVKGYTIPSGWLVMISPMAVHLNPKLFEDPLKFDPWRWREEKRSSMLKNYMPFGGGVRLCLGAEFSKLFIALFLHILVTEYSWTEIEGGEVLRISEIMFPQGYHIQLVPQT
uniref:Cytochrome P450 n=2 Tax=Oryza TaxID=4527 RepID=A0A0D3FZ41_9ORYZ